MTSKPTRAPAKKKQPAAVQTSESIAEKTRIYLESGKKIQSIEPGISGQTNF
jgi:predicted transcriptional regulator